MMMMMIDEIPQVIRSESDCHSQIQVTRFTFRSDMLARLQEFDYCCVLTSMILHPFIHCAIHSIYVKNRARSTRSFS